MLQNFSYPKPKFPHILLFSAGRSKSEQLNTLYKKQLSPASPALLTPRHPTLLPTHDSERVSEERRRRQLTGELFINGDNGSGDTTSRQPVYLASANNSTNNRDKPPSKQHWWMGLNYIWWNISSRGSALLSIHRISAYLRVHVGRGKHGVIRARRFNLWMQLRSFIGEATRCSLNDATSGFGQPFVLKDRWEWGWEMGCLRGDVIPYGCWTRIQETLVIIWRNVFSDVWRFWLDQDSCHWVERPFIFYSWREILLCWFHTTKYNNTKKFRNRNTRWKVSLLKCIFFKIVTLKRCAEGCENWG